MRNQTRYIAAASIVVIALSTWAPTTLATRASDRVNTTKAWSQAATARSMWAAALPPSSTIHTDSTSERRLSPAGKLVQDFRDRGEGRPSPLRARPASSAKVALPKATGWTATKAPRPFLPADPQVEIDQVSCPQSNDCYAIGSYGNAAGSFPGLLLHLTAQGWAAGAAPLPKNAAKGGYVDLLEIDCVTATHCTAVGDYSDTVGSEESGSADIRPLIETFQNGKWSAGTVPVPQNSDFHPDASLNSIACPSVAGCTAVGSYNVSGNAEPFISNQAAGVWKSRSAPTPSRGGGGGGFGIEDEGGLIQVFCSGPNQCAAVGSYANNNGGGALFDQEVNGKWKALSVPKGGEAYLDGVSCLPGGSCIAVGGLSPSFGGKTEGYAVSELKGKLSGETTPLPTDAPAKKVFEVDLYSIACSAVSCTAVGDWLEGTSTTSGNTTTTETGPGVPLLLDYRNGVWTAPQLPTDAEGGEGELDVVNCGSSGSCVAAGEYYQENGQSTLLMRGAGTHWTTQTIKGNPAFNYGWLSSVSCRTTCEAVGSYVDRAGNLQGLVVASDKSGWLGAIAPLPAGAGTAQNIELLQSSCPAPGSCVALGTNEERSIVTETFADGKWSVKQLPDPSGLGWGDTISPTGLSCWTPGNCVATANYATAQGGESAEVLTETKGVWAEITPPYPESSTLILQGALSGLTCSAVGTCYLVGVYATPNGQFFNWIVGNSGGTWKGYTVAAPANQTYGNQSQLLAAGCSSPTRCTLVGVYGKQNHALPLVIKGSGSSWTPSAAPVPAQLGSPAKLDGYLTAVSCSSSCVGTGFLENNKGVYGLIDTFSSKGSLSSEAPESSKQALEVDLAAPFCSAVTCVIVGASYGFDSGRALLIRGWGASWQDVTPTTGRPPANSFLNSVGCASLPGCFAAGGIDSNADGPQGQGASTALLANDVAGNWSLGLAPLPAGAATNKKLQLAYLNSVACPSSGPCISVGTYSDSSQANQGLIERR